MLLSRFWYVALGLAVGALFFVLSLAQGMFNRASDRARGEGLSADSQVVSSYLKDDSRQRSGQLVKFALDSDIAKTLQKASKSETKLPDKYREKVTAALKKVNATIPKEQAFDAIFAVDQHGRVVGQVGYAPANGMSDFELGGYPVVADALHGFIRDDTLVWGRIYRVVARPVQVEAGQRPAGAVIGARVLDDRFARELSNRTGAAVAFYVNGSRTAAGAPEGFLKTNLDQIVSDLDDLESDEDYQQKGRSGIRDIDNSLSVQYTRLPGEAYALGAGVAVAREVNRISSPFDFFEQADDTDKAAGNKVLAGGLVIIAILIGLTFSFLEHSLPLKKFKAESARLASGSTDQLQPSKFRGVYRKIAAELNEGIDKVAATSGGQSRRATNLEDVLGELPAQPQMAAFSVPGGDSPTGPASAPLPVAGAPGSQALPQAPARQLPKAPPSGGVLPKPAGGGPVSSVSTLGAQPVETIASTQLNAPAQVESPLAQAEHFPPAKPSPAAADPEADWKAVFEQFVSAKRQCQEPIDGFTYEKFRKTLVKNRDALIARHGVSQVKFAVHVKAGKAALKASPVKV